MNKRYKVVLLLGGESSEREVSLRSGKQIEAALMRLGHEVICVDPAVDGLASLAEIGPDVAFLALHGAGGEDGCVQGALELMKIPYTGSGVLASALAMDKGMSKKVFVASGVRTPSYATVNRNRSGEEEVRLAMESVGFPCVVKPSNQGSTVGITFAKQPGQLAEGLALAFKYGEHAVIERFVSGVEVTVGVLESGPRSEAQALPVLEIVAKNEFYDYDAKYTPGKSDHIIPARIRAAADEECRRLAVLAHTSLGCRGYSRVDMIVDSADDVWVLEVNTLPGMTDVSLLPDAARAVGISFDQLVSTILTNALG